MKKAFGMAVGIAIGAAIVSGVQHGLAGIEFGKVASIFVLCWLMLGIYYTIRKKRVADSDG